MTVSSRSSRGPRVRGRLGPGVTGVAAVVTVLSVTSCSSESLPRACTAIGLGPNAVNVTVMGAADLRGAVFEVCTSVKCTTTTRTAGNKMPTTAVANAGVSSTKPITITVSVRSARGLVLVPSTRLTVRPTRLQPNGPGCDPVGYVASAAVTAAT